jgi:hypothetical protein
MLVLLLLLIAFIIPAFRNIIFSTVWFVLIIAALVNVVEWIQTTSTPNFVGLCVVILSLLAIKVVNQFNNH